MLSNLVNLNLLTHVCLGTWQILNFEKKTNDNEHDSPGCFTFEPKMPKCLFAVSVKIVCDFNEKIELSPIKNYLRKSGTFWKRIQWVPLNSASKYTEEFDPTK